MRYLYIVGLAGLLPHLAAAQAPAAADSVFGDTTKYLIAVDERWVRSQTDSTGECTEVLHWTGRGGLVRVFHPSGQLKQYVPYADLEAGYKHGVVTTWYDNGQLANRQTFIQGRREGQLVLYYPNGQLKRQTQYAAGSESIGDCFDQNGTRLPYFPYEQPPLYPGGQLQLAKEINSALRRVRPTGPIYLGKAQIHVQFQVDANGSISNPQVSFSDAKFIAVGLPSSVGNQTAWQARIQETVAPLVKKVQLALTQLTKAFYPGQCDGSITNWQYSFIIPFEAGVTPIRTGDIRRRGTNFGP